MKKILVLLVSVVFSIILSAFSFAEDTQAPDAQIPGTEIVTGGENQASSPEETVSEQGIEAQPETAVDIQEDIRKTEEELETLQKQHRELMRNHDIDGAQALTPKIQDLHKKLFERRKELMDKTSQEASQVTTE